MATKIFTKGFFHKGFKFAWDGEDLYRLPTKMHGKHYPLRKVPVVKITDNISGYRVIRDYKSMAQVQEMTRSIKTVKLENAA